MRVDDRLAKQNKELEKKKKKQQDPDDGEITLTYLERLQIPPINKNKGVFHDNSGDGINTAQSVFDRTAIFHTGED